MLWFCSCLVDFYHAMFSNWYEIGCCMRSVLALSAACLDAMYLVVLQVHSMYWPGVSCQFCRSYPKLFAWSVVLGRNLASPVSCGAQPELLCCQTKTSAAIFIRLPLSFNSLRAMPDNCIHQWCNLIYMYLMNIFVPGMLYYGPVVRQVLSWADVRRPPAPCGSGCHNHWSKLGRFDWFGFYPFGEFIHHDQ